DQGIALWYDVDGNELDPNTGIPLTDAEIDAQWGRGPDPSLLSFVVKDIPVPAGGFPDPDTWEEPEKEEPAGTFVWGRSWDDPDDVPTREQLLSYVASHGAERTAAAYALRIEDLPKLVGNDGALGVNDR